MNAHHRTAILLLAAVIICLETYGQTSTTNGKAGPLLFLGKRVKDTTPPTIEIVEPANASPRGLKIAAEKGLVVSTSSIAVRGIARDSSGITIVNVNEREAQLTPVNGGCEFSSQVLLTIGENDIEVKATDKYGNEQTERFKVVRKVAIAEDPRSKIRRDLFKGQRWAVVVGISDYKDNEIPDLRYAHEDARAFFDLLVKPLEEGGMEVPKTNIRFLVDDQATYTNVREAFTDFLKNAMEEDIVFIYFAGHGAPDPDRPNVLYLLTHDSDMKRLNATSIRMNEVENALKDFVMAKKVTVFADACHSRGVAGGAATRALASPELVNQYLWDLAQARSSTLTFSASDRNQLSQEDKRWGGGHGVYTYHLIEGMKGKADFDKDGIVRLGELVQYVSDQVRRDTKSQQSPIPSGSYDVNMPLTVVPEKK